MVNYQLMNVKSHSGAVNWRCSHLRGVGGRFSARLLLYRSSMDQRAHPEETPGTAADERDQRVTNLFLLVFFAVIVGSGLWLVNAMVEQRAIDDCAAQGRRNCAPIETPAR